MNLQRREEIRVMMNRLESTEWVEAGEYKEAMGELLAHIDTLEQAAAPAAVAPDDDRPSREFLENYVEGFDPGERSAALFGWREGRRHIREHSRAIPADRVLGEGEIKGTPEELAKIAESAGWKWIRSPIESKETKTLVEWMTDALRANQGGAAT